MARIRWPGTPRLFRRSLRTKIIAWFFVPTAIILLAVALVTLYAYQRVTADLVIERDQELVRLSASQIATQMTEYTDLLLEAARAIALSPDNPDAEREAIERSRGRLVVFDGGVVILDNFGRVMEAEPARPDLMGQDWSNFGFFRQMVRSPEPAFSNVRTVGPQETDVIVFAVPIIGGQGEFLGSVVGMFQLGATAVSAFYGEIVKMRIAEGGATYLIDSNGRVIYHTAQGRIGADFSAQPVVRQVLAGQAGALRTRSFEGEDIVAGFSPVPGTPWGLVTEETWAALTSASHRYQRFLLLLLGLGVAAPAVVVVIGLRQIMRPVEDLIGAARQVAAGNFSQAIAASTGDEIEELATEFNIMAAQLQESYTDLEKRVEARTRELQESEERLRTVITGAPVVMFAMDENGIFTLSEGRALDALGLQPGEIVGKSAFEIYGGVPHIADSLHRALEGEELTVTSFIDELAFETRYSPLQDEDGNLKGAIGVATDVTERRRAEVALRQSEEEARRLARENAVVAEIGRILSSSLEIEQVYDRFAEEVSKLLPFDRISIGIVDAESGSFTDTYHMGIEVPGRGYGTVVPLAGSVTEEVVRTRTCKLVHMDDEEELARKYPPMLAGFSAGLRTSVSVPLISKDTVIGVLHLQSMTSNAYTQHDLDMALRVGSQIAGAIANWLLFSELVTIQEALLESEERLRSLVQAVPIPVILTRVADGEVLYANEHVNGMFGFTPDELTGRKSLDLYYDPLDRETLIAEMRRKGYLRNRELRAMNREGWPIWVNVSAQPTVFDGQETLLTSFTDITERKRAEELFRSLAQSSPIGIFVIEDSRFKFVNVQASRESGYSEDELLEQIASDYVFPDDRDMVRRQTARIQSGETIEPFEYRILKRDGEAWWILGNFGPITYEGRPALVGTYMDITDRKRAEEQLRDSLNEKEALLHEIQHLYQQGQAQLEHMRIINDVATRVSSIYSLDELLPFVADLLYQTFNPYSVNIGLIEEETDELVIRASAGRYAGESPIGKTFKEGRESAGICSWVASTGQHRLANNVSEDPLYYHLEEFSETKSELAVPISIGDQVIGVMDIGGDHVNAFSDMDVSTALNIANQLAIAIENARLLDETRDLAVLEERNRMAREIHDTMAQGFTGIVLQLEAAEQAYDETPEELPEHLMRAKALARECLQEARRSVWNLLPRALEERPLADALNEEIQRFAVTGREKASFRVIGSRRELSSDVQAALLRICQESLTNIRKHANASEVNVTLEFKHDSMSLAIKDNGVGIGGDSNTDEVMKGGFGLNGMEQRARLLRGTLAIKSKKGQGTQVEATIPTT